MMQIRALGLDDPAVAVGALWPVAPAGQRPPERRRGACGLCPPGLTHYGGFVDGQLVASCNLAVIPNLTRGGRAYGVIENVITDAAHRGQGRGPR